MNDLEYLKMGKWGQMAYDLRQYFIKLPGRFVNGIVGLVMTLVNLVKMFGAGVDVGGREHLFAQETLCHGLSHIAEAKETDARRLYKPLV